MARLDGTVCRTVFELRAALQELPPTMPVTTIAPPFDAVQLVVREGKLMIAPPDPPSRRRDAE